MLNTTCEISEDGGNCRAGVKPAFWLEDIFKSITATVKSQNEEEAQVVIEGGAAQMVFDANNYETEQYIIITGQDDLRQDGTVTVIIEIEGQLDFKVRKRGEAIYGQKPVMPQQIAAQNLDNDVAGLHVVQMENGKPEDRFIGTPSFEYEGTGELYTGKTLVTDEAGTKHGWFHVKLLAEPERRVNVPVSVRKTVSQWTSSRTNIRQEARTLVQSVTFEIGIVHNKILQYVSARSIRSPLPTLLERVATRFRGRNE